MVVAVALLFAALLSPVLEDAVAVLDSTVAFATVAPTLTVSVNTELPTAKLACVQETVPPAPTDGVAHDQPATVGNDTNVVPAGRVSDGGQAKPHLGLCWSVMVYVRLLPAVTGSRVSTLVMARSATRTDRRSPDP